MPFISKISNFGVYFLVLGLACSFGLVAMSLPGVGMGIWPQSEFAVVGLHLSSFICAFGLLLFSFRYKRMSVAVANHPMVLIPLAIGVWSLCVMPFQNLPLRHFLGAPQNGEGVVFWLDWAVLTASIMIIAHTRFFLKGILVVALLGFIAATVLTFSYVYFEYYMTPYYFPDFLAVNFFLLSAVLVAAFKMDKLNLISIVCIIVFYGLLYLTKNNISIAFGLLGISFFLFSEFALRRFPVFKNYLYLFVLIVLPVVAFSVIWGLYVYMNGEGFYAFNKIVYARNVLSRSYLVWIGLQPLFDSYSVWFTGSGWGSFTEHAVEYLPTEWFDFTKEDSQWEGISWDQFHTHDMFVDLAYSVGIVGAILFALYFVSAPLYVKTKHKLVMFITSAYSICYVSFWFLFPVNVPYFALAFGSMASLTIGKRAELIKTPFLLIIFPFICLMQFYAVVVHIRTVMATHHYEAQSLSIDDIQYECPLEYYDGGAGGLHLSRILVSRVRQAVSIAQEQEVDIEMLKDTLTHLNHLYCQAQQYGQQNPQSNRLKIALLIVQNELLLGVSNLDPEYVEYYALGWKSNIKRWLNEMPNRTDQAVPFLLWHMTHQKEQDVFDVANIIYEKNSDDPIGLWFTGFVLLGQESSQKSGLNRLRKAIENGVERFIPIEEELKKNLK